MFLQVGKSNSFTDRIIKSVTYHLPDEYSEPVIKVTKSPFQLERVGYSADLVGMEVEFRNPSLGTRLLYHEISFEGQGHTQAYIVKTQSKDSDCIAHAVAAKMGKQEVALRND